MVNSLLHIDSELANEIEEVISSYTFPWVWRSSSKYGREMAGIVSKDFQFIHNIYANNEAQSKVFELVQQVITEFETSSRNKVRSIYTVKANLLPKQILDEEGLAETIHIDVDASDKKFVTIVYYVIDSDGDTVLYKDDGSVAMQVPPKKELLYTFHQTCYIEQHRQYNTRGV